MVKPGGHYASFHKFSQPAAASHNRNFILETNQTDELLPTEDNQHNPCQQCFGDLFVLNNAVSALRLIHSVLKEKPL